ncbi:S-4TM family putative pore-forming effector [Micromonospora humida]|uniref:S-4TM family putative pore-forming effector n=1 Tax=Micromonospora humida TaxID=2809018 RepID=UPI0033E1889E
MTECTDSLLRRQNEPDMMAVLRAMSVCHSRAQRLDSLRMWISVGVGVAGAVVAFTGVSGTAVTAVGALWAVANAVGLGSWSEGQIRRAAVLQEMFDVELFGLPWNTVAVGERISAHEVSRLDRAYRGGEQYLRDYYEVPPLPAPWDVLACQQQNLGWGARLRRRYAHAVLAGVIGWVLVGMTFGVLAGLTVSQLLLQWFVPSLGALLLGIEIYRGQRNVAADRDRAMAILYGHITSALRRREHLAPATELMTVARQIQDVIFLSRRGQPRVPNWFFRRFHAADRLDFQSTMDSLAELLTVPAPVTRLDG